MRIESSCFTDFFERLRHSPHYPQELSMREATKRRRRIQLNAEIVLLFRIAPVPFLHGVIPAQGEMRFGQRLIQPQSVQCHFLCFGKKYPILVPPLIRPEISRGEIAIGGTEIRVGLNRALEVVDSHWEVRPSEE